MGTKKHKAETFSSKAEFEQAVQSAQAAARAYYDTDAQLMADAEYDRLLERIEVAMTEHPDWSDEGLLDDVAAGVSRGGDVVHPFPMLSLSKAKQREDIETFCATVAHAVVVEVKLDGMAVRAEYKRGQLALVATRGDGLTGEDVTAQAKDIAGLPSKLQRPLDLEVRGEVFMTNADFDVANANRVQSGKPAFVNPRNATAGTLRNRDLGYHAPMTFAAYDVSGQEVDDLDSHVGRMSIAFDLGVGVAAELLKHLKPALTTGLISTAEAALEFIDAINEVRSELDFPIDGAVVKVDSMAARERLGAASQTPRWALAFKYPADVATTILRDIEVSVGRTGNMSLRAVLEPVFVGGTTVTYATLHNPKFVTDAGFGIGDTVYVYRAGDVIPRVSAVAARGEGTRWVPPINCPSCGENWDHTSQVWRCRTPECSIVGRIDYAASRDVLDIDGLSTAMAEALVESGLVNDVADLFALSTEQIAGLRVGGATRVVGTQVAQKIIAQIAAAKGHPLGRVIAALGLRGTGRRMSRRLASQFGSIEVLCAASVAELSEVEGIGSEKSALIFEELKAAAPIIAKLKSAGVSMVDTSTEQSDSTNLPLAGEVVVVTGTVPGLSRNEANEAVEVLGGKSSGSVSAKTTLLVAGDGAGSKATKAQQLGIRIMPADEFAALFEAHR